MNGQSSSLEPVESTSLKISRSFFHEGITFDEKKCKVIFSDEARISLEQLIEELKTQFTEIEEELAHTGEITISNALQVSEIMKNEGKGDKSIKKFNFRFFRVLYGIGKKKQVQKETEKVERKIKKHADDKKIEVTIEYQTEVGRKKIEGVNMPIRANSTADSVIHVFNVFLGNQKIWNERKK